MKNQVKKTNLDFSKVVIATAVGLSAFTLIYILSQYKSSKVHYSNTETKQINYDMVKIENQPNDYSLSDREVDSVFQALEKKISKLLSKNKEVSKAKVSNKKKSSKVEDKKKAFANQVQKTESFKRNENTSKVKQNDIKNSISTNSLTQTSSTVSQSVNSFSNVQNNVPVKSLTPNVVNAEQQPEVKPELKSINQWKNEILTAQNKEVVLKFASAFKKGEISLKDYQSLTTELIKSEDQKIIGLGLYILRTTPSEASFVQLIKAQGQLSPEYSLYVEESLLSYNQTANLGVLKFGLVHAEKVIVAKTLAIINSGLNRIKDGMSADLVDSRERRLDQTKTFSIANYASFVSELQKILASGDTDLSQLASQNIELIGAQSVAAN